MPPGVGHNRPLPAMATADDDACAVYRALVEGAPSAVLVADERGRYTDANSAALRLLGFGRTELLTLGVQDVLVEPRAWTEATSVALRSGRGWHGDLSLRRKGGATVSVDVHARAIRLPGGGVAYAAFLQDAV